MSDMQAGGKERATWAGSKLGPFRIGSALCIPSSVKKISVTCGGAITNFRCLSRLSGPTRIPATEGSTPQRCSTNGLALCRPLCEVLTCFCRMHRAHRTHMGKKCDDSSRLSNEGKKRVSRNEHCALHCDRPRNAVTGTKTTTYLTRSTQHTPLMWQQQISRSWSWSWTSRSCSSNSNKANRSTVSIGALSVYYSRARLKQSCENS